MQEKREQILEIAAHHGAYNVRVFGSGAKGTAGSDSDLDLLVLVAVKLYELGRLSSGRAAELAGVPRVEFLLALGCYKVCPFEAELREQEDAAQSEAKE